jgi:hypothetical protein
MQAEKMVVKGAAWHREGAGEADGDDESRQNDTNHGQVRPAV